MANHKSAIKRQGQNERRRRRNQALQSSVRSTLKNTRLAIESKDEDAIALKLKAANRALYKAVTKGILTRNAAARKLARLSRAAHAAVRST